METCKIPDCSRVHKAKGYCEMHYYRFRIHGDPLGGRATKHGEVSEYIKKVALTYEGDECLRWPFSSRGDGRGQVFWGGKLWVASRLVCTLAHGEPPSPKHEAAHSCGKGDEGCVTKSHLRWATRKENEDDKIIHGTRPSGEGHASSTITKAKALEILQAKGSGTHGEIAIRFGTSKSTVGRILRGELWVGAAIEGATL